MTEGPCTIDQDEGSYEAMNPMAQNGVRRIPISGATISSASSRPTI
ncbi:CBS domain-containing protein [Natronorubrum halophilum]|nr:CBS domain-containing protein [Natronorubrum halophilum]